MFKLRLFIYFHLILALSSCGRMGPPKPPEESAPQAVRYLELVADDASVKLRFQAPLNTVGGEDIIDLSTFYIGRRILSKDSSESFTNIAELDFNPEKNNPKSDWFEYEDQSIAIGGQYEYIVLAEDAVGYVSQSPYTLRVTFLGANSIVENLPNN